MSRLRLIFIVFFMTAVLIMAVSTRTTSRRIFYKYRTAHVDQEHLKQQLWHKQLTLASMTTPTEISRRLKKSGDDD